MTQSTINRYVDCYIDLLKISFFYDEYLNNATFDEGETFSIAKNGKICVLAIIIFFLKFKQGNFDLKSNDWRDRVKDDNIRQKGSFLSKVDNYKELFEDLCFRIITALDTIYSSEKKQDSRMTVSNFFKTDVKYFKTVLSEIRSIMLNTNSRAREFMDIIDKLFT